MINNDKRNREVLIMKKKRKSRKIKRKIFTGLTLLALLVGMAFFLVSGDNLQVVKSMFRDDMSREEIQDTLSLLGWKGYITFGTLSFLQVVLTFMPSEPAEVMAGISFGLWVGSLVCVCGVALGNTCIFILYKIYGGKISEYFHNNAEFDFDSIRHSKRVSLIVLILYFLPAIPYGIICFFSATLDLKYPKYIILTTLGSIPSIIIGVGLGHIAMAANWIIALVVFIVLIILLVLLMRHRAALFKKVNEFAKKKNEPYSSKTTVRNANKFVFHGALATFNVAIRRKVKVKQRNNVGRLETPSLVLANHGSFFDFYFAGRLLKKEYPHFVSARLYFYHKKLGWLIRRVGAFPKSMFTSDVENAKNCMRVITNQGVLAMMPEARLSTVGKFEDIQPSTYRFIQKLNVPVYYIQIRGAYFAKPKWGDKLRKGAYVEVELNPLFKTGETKTMPLEELKKRVDEVVSYDEFAWLETKPELSYKSKTLAVGLENILTRCPHCGGRYTFTTAGRTISCSACGFSRTLDSRYAFTEPVPFENFAKWYEWQTDEMEKEFRENPDFALESEVELRHCAKDGKSLTRFAGNGICTLDKTGLLYRGTDDGVEVEKFFPLSEIYRLLFGAGEDFEIYEGAEIYYFKPKDLRSCVDWYIASKVLDKIYK